MEQKRGVETEKKQVEKVKKNYFDKALFYQISIRELLIDLLLLVFAFLFSESFFAPGGLFHRLEQWQVLALFCVVVLTMPYQFGYLYEKFSEYFPKGIMKVILWVFILIVFMTLVNLVRLTLAIEDIENPKHNESGFFAVFAMFMLVLGPMTCIAGAVQASSDAKAENSNEFNFERFGAIGAFGMIILAIVFMIIFIGMLPEKYSGWAAVVGMFLGPLAAVLVLLIFMLFMKFLSSVGLYKYLAFFAQNMVPFFVISVLVFWSGVTLHFMYNDFSDINGKISFGALLFSILISGLFPFRIITMLAPPLRITHLVIGSVTLIVFLFSMFGLS